MRISKIVASIEDCFIIGSRAIKVGVKSAIVEIKCAKQEVIKPEVNNETKASE